MQELRDRTHTLFVSATTATSSSSTAASVNGVSASHPHRHTQRTADADPDAASSAQSTRKREYWRRRRKLARLRWLRTRESDVDDVIAACTDAARRGESTSAVRFCNNNATADADSSAYSQQQQQQHVSASAWSALGSLGDLVRAAPFWKTSSTARARTDLASAFRTGNGGGEGEHTRTTWRVSFDRRGYIMVETGVAVFFYCLPLPWRSLNFYERAYQARRFFIRCVVFLFMQRRRSAPLTRACVCWTACH